MGECGNILSCIILSSKLISLFFFLFHLENIELIISNCNTLYNIRMFEISQLKAKKLPELQDIAKQLNVPKYRSMKKLDLVYQILDYQAANPEAVKAQVETDSNQKPEQKQNKPQQKRARVQRKPKENNDQKSLEFSDKKE